jgi:hypothetical protein
MPLPINPRFAGTTALGGHVARALDFAARTDVWAVLGKPTSWSGTDPLTSPPNQTVSDTVPPIPNPATTALAEPVAAVKVDLSLVVPDNAGTIEAYGQKWRTVTTQQAMAQGCRWVMVKGSFDYNGVPIKANDSFLTVTADAGSQTLTLKSAAGYQVGDNVIVDGVDGLNTTVDAVDTGAKTIHLADPLPDAVYAGRYVTNLSAATRFQYRQVGVLSHVTFPGQAQPGQKTVPAEWLTDGLLEWYYNDQPIPRRLNGRDALVLILTF